MNALRRWSPRPRPRRRDVTCQTRTPAGPGADGTAHISGLLAGRADRQLVEELHRFARGEGFDEQPLPELDSEALDFRAASESFAPIRKLGRRDLETLRLVTAHQGRTVPTVGGMLLFGRERERHFPAAWIQAGRFQGTDKSRILDRAEFRSYPVRAIEEAIRFLRHPPRRVPCRGAPALGALSPMVGGSSAPRAIRIR